MYENVSLTELEYFRLWRKRNGVTLNKMAKILNCSPSWICLFENGKRNIDDERLQKYRDLVK